MNESEQATIARRGVEAGTENLTIEAREATQARFSLDQGELRKKTD
jgi:hypothetical protein